MKRYDAAHSNIVRMNQLYHPELKRLKIDHEEGKWYDTLINGQLRADALAGQLKLTGEI